MKTAWDTQIQDIELEHKWREWLRDLENCENLVVARSLTSSKEFSSTQHCELVGFSDGSSVGYGCTLYLRWYDESEKVIDVKFVGAKGKLNPIKGTTVPRSEMCGAFTLSRLSYSAQNALKKTELASICKSESLFTDSSTVLAWIKSGAMKYKPFVKNKIIEVQELHPIDVWKYIPSAKNKTADMISKGCKYKDLDNIIRGPNVLYTPKET